ncbi:MAG: M50 family metallopeptidase [Anaerolineales bacterium]|jgi:regulator of sigma E protease
MLPIQLAQFVLGIAVLLLLHELGHFIAARMLNVEVEEFGIGFPPRALKLFRYKGTLYSLNWIPLGGFVRPKGENDPSIPGGLAAASPWVRLGVLFAGPTMNLLVGVILGIFLFYSIGNPVTDKVIISHIEPDTPAQEAMLMEGDIFITVNAENIDSSLKLQEIISENLGKPTEFVIQRGDSTIKVTITPRSEYPDNQGPIGVGITNPTTPVSIGTAITRGVGATFEQIRALFLLPVRLLQGQASPEEGRLLGYKGMFDIFLYLQSPLWFFMAISISLGILNLFPIPALDGGRIVLILPEILFKKRIPAQYENMIHMVGFTLLLFVLIYINVQDFLNPIQLP